MSKINILFVCMGNICRSPTAQGMFEYLLEQEGLSDEVYVDSAGTHAYHVGKSPDERAMRSAAARGIDLGAQRARRIEIEDFERFDYVLAMDSSNLDDLMALCPEQHREKLALFLDFAEELPEREVPDPYYGGAQGFERVLDLIEEGSRSLLESVRERL
ncbi:MAG TPA: low molecular weight phosphotyrosine protein phosphatase [Gammaproteobacteria bacterium]|nr:low molecular weight phosphotyrosine protein phosphatase [Gammaproteobacteria bacterium]